MKQTLLSLLVAAAVIGIALLAKLGVVSAEAAQFAPFLLLALVPAAWQRTGRTCDSLKAC